MTDETELVLVHEDDGVLTLTLNRPQASNALDGALVDALDSALDSAQAASPRCVVLRAAGKRFCVGGDVTTFGAGVDADEIAAHVLRTASVVRRLHNLEAPLVTVVHGAVAGAGLALVLAADIVVAARSTRFVPAYSALGLTPDVGVSWLLPRIVGERRAVEYLVTGREITADEARDWGIVAEVVDDDDAAAGRAAAMARRIADSGDAARETKRLLRAASRTTADESAADEAATFRRALVSDVAQRRIAAFLDRP